MDKAPIVIEVFTDNGEHSHWELINPVNGELLYSEDWIKSWARLRKKAKENEKTV